MLRKNVSYTSCVGKIIYRSFKGIVSILLLLVTFGYTSVLAQSNASGQMGIIKGKVKDSVYHFVMNSATVAVYKASDSSLLRFTMPNEFGEFVLQPLPTETPLKFIITHVGYKPFIKKVTIQKDKPAYDLGWVYMYQNDSSSAGADVIVTSIAPMRMNGDTVEFNADAFRLDSNATAEDLLRKLPGFTVWGDGDITYNGKEIKQLLVDGKPFLGGTDFTAATQNLPKNALEKVQVYQQRDDKNPLDSTMFANLKLKDDKKMGHFGKVSAGYGTDKHYAADGMLTGFNKKMQLSAAAGANNINKMARNMDILIKNASYKGVGANTDYQSDFSMTGLNKPIAAGMKFQYDFIPDPQYLKQSRLNADYFFNRNSSANISKRTTNRFLSADSILSTISNSSSNNISTNHNLNATYFLQTPQSNLTVGSSFSSADNNNSSTSTSQQLSVGKIASINTSNNQNKDLSNTWSSSIGYDHTQKWTGKPVRIPSNFSLKYSFSLGENTGDGRTQSNFHSVLDSSIDKTYDRLYKERNSNSFNQTIYAQYPDLKTLIFGRARMGGIQMVVDNTLNLNRTTASTSVLDLDSTTQQYQLNTYLTNNRDLHITDENPSLSLSKTFAKTLTNRYSKSLSINLNLKEQYYRFEHTATQVIQNIAYNYQEFLPNFSLSYYNHQFGEYEINSSINYNTKANYPSISGLAPLIDSTNLQYIHIANPYLKPEYEKDWAFQFTLKSRKPKNPWQITVNGTYGNTSDVMADSTNYNNLGQQIVRTVNLQNAEYTHAGWSYRKSFEAKRNTYRIAFNYNYNLYKSPGYTNGVLNLSKSTSNSFQVNQDYAHLDRITLNAVEGLTYYTSEQQGFNNSKFDNNNLYVRFSGALQLPKNLIWSSNITYNHSGSDNSATINYTIWNASLAYRFLHGNRGEVKFSAMDLLHQNKGIINTTKGAVQTMGYNNVLQQYFMLTLAYYPRKFGK